MQVRDYPAVTPATTSKPAGPAAAPEGLPGMEHLERLTYQIIAFGFPLLTLTIITGAVWAQSAWGRWWGWDPKETASLVAWLIYAAYLHGRARRGWQGTPSAIFAMLGYLTVLFCFAGVNLLGGLHAYGAPQVIKDGHLNLGGLHGINVVEAWLTRGFISAFLLSMLSYLAFGISKARALGTVASTLAIVGFLGLTATLGVRTYHAGHLPLTSGYDFSLCFVWGATGAYLVIERLRNTRMLGAFALPIVLLLLMYAYLMFPDKSGTLLMPALQNKFWLHVHVAMAVLAYGSLTLSFATAIMYFVKKLTGGKSATV